MQQTWSKPSLLEGLRHPTMTTIAAHEDMRPPTRSEACVAPERWWLAVLTTLPQPVLPHGMGAQDAPRAVRSLHAPAFRRGSSGFASERGAPYLAHAEATATYSVVCDFPCRCGIPVPAAAAPPRVRVRATRVHVADLWQFEDDSSRLLGRGRAVAPPARPSPPAPAAPHGRGVNNTRAGLRRRPLP